MTIHKNAVRFDSVELYSTSRTRPGPHRPPAVDVPTSNKADPQYQPPPPPPPPDAQAQPQSQPPEPPPPVAPQQLDQLVQRIALYPDPLLAQVLTASTFWQQIPDAATWAQQHSNLTGDALAQAIQADNLPWDPSVLALLPFPSVLDMMAARPAVDRQSRQRRPRSTQRRHGRRPAPASGRPQLRLSRIQLPTTT